MLFFKFLKFFKNLVVKFAILSLLLEQFFIVVIATSKAVNGADLPITPDGSTNTQIVNAPNGAAVVNIAPTNPSGLSHNKYTDYNVNQKGLIINNAVGNQDGFVLTQIGGLINDNLNLKNSGSASIILNEVTSSNISQINGFTEIAGSKADLILANPNGFVFNGAGFINVDKLTAIVGSSNHFNANPSELNFKLSNGAEPKDSKGNNFLPKLIISGKGLDLEKVNYSDLVANIMSIVAEIYAGNNDVNLRSGDDSFDYLSKAVASSKIESSSPPCDNQATQCPDSEVNKSDSIAIDASALGKIQAGKIFIIATKEGFGIKYNADLLAQRSGIVIDSQGNIDYQNVSATGNANQANISITSHHGSITQNGIIQTKDLANNITLNAFKEIKNYGKFFSSADVDIESKTQDFINYSQSNLAKNNFTIKAINFSNLGEITAENNLKINTHQVSNSHKLVANANLIINADQINNRNSLYSQNNIALNANEINNNTQDSQIYALNDIALKTNSINNTDGKIQAKNNLKLQDLALNDLSPDWQFKINDQLISINNANGNFYAKNLLEFDLQNANYSIAGDLKSDGKIKITARNITNQINLQANNDLEIIALDTFTNGVLNGDNSNTKIIANNKLFITATNLLSNYATLSAKNNLQLTSLENNINNHIKAEIIAGTKTKIDSQDGKEKYLYQGLLTLNAKNGIVNQNSLNSIIVNGNYNLDVTDFINTGKVEVAGDLFFNIANDLINDVKALILAEGNLEINVGNDLTNKTDAVIYSQGNLTIQKYPSSNPLYNPEDNKINKLTNSSGQIISYNGDMTINAKTIENKRTIDPGVWLIKPNRSDNVSYSYSWDDGQYDLTFTNHYLYSWGFVDDRCFGHKCAEYQARYRALAPLNSNSVLAKIFSGKTMTLNSDITKNIDSEILSVADLTINGDLVNSSKNYPEIIYMQTSHRQHEYSDEAGDFTDGFSWFNLSGDKNFLAKIKAGGSFKGNGFAKLKNIIITPNYAKNSTTKFNEYISNQDNVVSQATVDGSNEKKSISEVNSLNVSEVVDKGIINLDLSNYFSAQSVIGLFVKSFNPNSPLFETRSQFIDKSKFFGSDYFYQKIGLNLTDLQTQFEQQNQRLVGDQFFQNKIISDQLVTITKNSFLLSAKETNANNEIKSLLDNASDEYKRLNLTANKALSSDQINSLQKDIVWYEAQNINGSSYIVPKIYLSKTSRDNLKNQALATKSTIYAGGDLEINSSSGSLNNSGSIIANNIKITTKDDIINNNFSEMIASNDLALNSLSGSITNRSKLEANNDLTLVAKKNITNTSTVITNDSNLLNSGNVGYVANGLSQDNQSHIASKILETATILAGNITINAGEDFNNNAANITTTKNTLVDNSTTSGNITITAGDDINISTLELKNRTETSWQGKKRARTSITQTTTNVGSNFDIAGNLTLATNGLGLADEQAKIEALNAQIQAKYDAELADYYKKLAEYDARNNSLISSGNSDADLKMAINNNVSSTNNSAVGNLIKHSQVPPTRPALPTFYGPAQANINIIGSNLNATGNIKLIAKDEVNILSAIDTYQHEERSRSKSSTVKKTYESSIDKITNVSSNINSGGNIDISSGADTTIFASNLSANSDGNITAGAYTDNDPLSLTYGNTVFNNSANLNIVNGVDSERFFSKSTKIKTGLSIENALLTATMVAAVAFTAGAAAGAIVASGVAGGAVGSVNQQKNTKTEFHYHETIVKSNLSFGNKLNLTAINDIAIQSSNIITGTKNISDQKDLGIMTGRNLVLNSATENHQTSYESKDKGNYFFENGQSGNYNTKVIDTEIDIASGNGNLNLNIGNSILASYKKGSYEDVSNQKLAYLNQLDPTITVYNAIDEINKNWDQASRGLTKAGQAVVAITATAITAGTMGPVGGSISKGILVGGISSTASIASSSAINSAMNSNGDIFKQLKTISNDTWDNTTSKESVKNIIIASLVGGLATGLTNMISGGTFMTPATSSAGKIAANASNFERVSANLKTSFQEISAQTLASTTAQSAINGDSFVESLKNQGKNVLIYTLAKVGANEIGRAYHGVNTPTTLTDSNANTLTNLDGNIMTTTSSPLINKPTQLLLHAGLGATTSALTGNDLASGAIAGVVGEQIAETAYNNAANINPAIQLASLSSAISSIAYGGLANQSDEQMANNAWEGTRIGGNAGENNALAPGAIVGGVIGATGAATVAYIDGERDPKKIATAAAVGGAIGVASGALGNVYGVAEGIKIGTILGAIDGGLEGYFTIVLTNPNASTQEIINNTTQGAFSGAVGGAVGGGFGGAVGATGATGYAAESVFAMMGLGAGVASSAITSNYNSFNTNQIQYIDYTPRNLAKNPSWLLSPHFNSQSNYLTNIR